MTPFPAILFRLGGLYGLIWLMAFLPTACTGAGGPEVVFRQAFRGQPVDLVQQLGGQEFVLRHPETDEKYHLEVVLNPKSMRTSVIFGPFGQYQQYETVFEGVVTKVGEVLLLQRPARDVMDIEQPAESVFPYALVYAIQLKDGAIHGLMNLPEQPARLGEHLEEASVGALRNQEGVFGVEGGGEGPKKLIARPDTAAWLPRFESFLAGQPGLEILERSTKELHGGEPSPQVMPKPGTPGPGNEPPEDTTGIQPSNQQEAGRVAPANLPRGVHLARKRVSDQLRVDIVGQGQYRWEMLSETGNTVDRGRGIDTPLILDTSAYEDGKYYFRFFSLENPYADTFTFHVDHSMEEESGPPDNGLEGEPVD